MKVRVEVVCLNADGDEQRRQVLTIERRELAMETLGMNLTEGKALLADVQDFVVAQQVPGFKNPGQGTHDHVGPITDQIVRRVATLRLPRGRLTGCSSWPLRFAVY